MIHQPPRIDPNTLDGLRDLLGLAAEDTIRRLVRTFRAQRTRLEKDAKIALDAGDAVALARAAHVLKGACHQLGVSRAATRASELEQLARDGDIDGATPALDALVEELSLADPLLDEL